MIINFIGDIYLDIIAKDVERLPVWETDTLANISMIAGGSCLNSIVHAKTYVDYLNIHHTNDMESVKLNIFSSVGDDSQGRVCMDCLTRAELSTDNIVVSRTERTGSCIVLSGSSDRCFISDRGCIDKLSISSFNLETLLNCNHLHFSGFYNCSKLRDDASYLFPMLKAKGITISLNPQYDASGKWDQIQELCPYLNIIIANKDELSHITRNNNIDEAAAMLLAKGCAMIIATAGSTGSTYYSLDTDGIIQILHVDSFQLDMIVDATGAGDAYVGGFLVYWLMHKDPTSAMRAASLCGATSVSCFGGSTSSIETMIDIERKHAC